jgi:hypothetical protein
MGDASGRSRRKCWSSLVQVLLIPHRESRLEPKDRAQSGHTGEERILRAMMLGAIGPCTSEPTVQDA